MIITVQRHLNTLLKQAYDFLALKATADQNW